MIDCQRDEKSIFNAARAIESPAARADYLRQACGHDSVLRDRVVALLHTLETERNFLELPLLAGDSTVDLPPLAERPCATIGRYKLLQEIGEGGMGVVYMAEQQEPVPRVRGVGKGRLLRRLNGTFSCITRWIMSRSAFARHFLLFPGFPYSLISPNNAVHCGEQTSFREWLTREALTT